MLARPPSALYRTSRMIARNRFAFAAGAAVTLAILLGGALATVSFFQERAGRQRAVAAEHRAEREAAAAQRALAELKASAPTLLELAESEARLQRFPSAQAKLDAALALDPALLPAYWRRAWVFLGEERFGEAAAALRVARAMDSTAPDTAAIQTLLDEIAAAPAAARWTGDRGSRLLAQLQRVGASGESVVLARQLQLGFAEKLKLVQARIVQWLGADALRFVKQSDAAGEIEVALNRSGIATLEPLRGLPLTRLYTSFTKIANLEPLRGMPLSTLWIEHTQVADLSPLEGMPLRTLRIAHSRVRDLSPLRGLPLEDFTGFETPIEDFSPLRGAPLKSVSMSGLFTSDLTFLADSPLEWLNAHANEITDLTPLRGKPLRWLAISANQVRDLSPLRGAPLEGLRLSGNPVTDLTPLLDLPKLEHITVSRWGKPLEVLRAHPTLRQIGYENEGFRPVTEFWAEYDANRKAANE